MAFNAGGGESLQARLERARQMLANQSAADGGESPPQPLTDWETDPAVVSIQQRAAELADLGVANPYFRPHETVSTNPVRIAGRELLNFSSYNYLGLSGHPEVSAAAKAAIDQFGTSASASRIASGEITIHGELERELTDFLGVDACLVFVSGYGTNVATLGHLIGPRDLVLHDAWAHSSILAGAQLSGARRMPFPHNDVERLDELLSAHRRDYQRALIVVEGVYSMDGDIAPLDRLVELKKRHAAALMVDEAHSLGVLGDTGRGIGEHFGIRRQDVEIWMGTLSKTLAGCGGYIAGSAGMVNYLRYTAPGFIYSVGLSPADTAAALAALRVLRREPDRPGRLRQLATYFLECASARGLDTGASAGSAVVPIILGQSMLAMRVADALFRGGINMQPMIYPAVEETAARLRVFVTINHTRSELERAADDIAAALASCASS